MSVENPSIGNGANVRNYTVPVPSYNKANLSAYPSDVAPSLDGLFCRDFMPSWGNMFEVDVFLPK